MNHGTETVKAVTVKDYYTQAEAAVKLRFTPEYVLDQMFISNAPLHPAVILKDISMKKPCKSNPISRAISRLRGLRRRRHTTLMLMSRSALRWIWYKPEMKSGLFDLFMFKISKDDYLKSGHLPLYYPESLSYVNLHSELQELRKISASRLFDMGQTANGNRIKSRGIGQFITLNQDGVDYLLCEPKSIPLSDLLVSGSSLEAYAAWHGIDLVADEPTTTGTPDKKGGLQYAVEKYLDRNADGTWEGFRIFLDEKLNLSKQEVLFGKIKYRDFFQKTDKSGILLHNPKQGKTPADANFNRYTVADIKAVIRKEKAKRQRK